MKYTISDFSQLAAVNFNLHSVDLHMLRWIVDFIHSERMHSIILDNEKLLYLSPFNRLIIFNVYSQNFQYNQSN